jgi:Transposase IS66 family
VHQLNNAPAQALPDCAAVPTGVSREEYGCAYQRCFPLTVRFLGSKGLSSDIASEIAQSPWTRGWECRRQLRDLPKSALGQAVTYTLNMWEKLRRCFDYAEVELSNNLAENSMRGIALGRKNWLHVGSAPAGPKVAAILSVVESCRRLRVPVKDYLTAVLPGLGNRALSEVAHLTPARWSVSRA